MLNVRTILSVFFLFTFATFANEQSPQMQQTNTPPLQTNEKTDHSSKTNKFTQSHQMPPTLNSSNLNTSMPSKIKIVTNLETPDAQQKQDYWLKNVFNGINLRHQLFHYTLWNNSMPCSGGSESSFIASYHLRRFNQRLIPALLDYKTPYIKTGWWYLGSWIFHQP